MKGKLKSLMAAVGLGLLSANAAAFDAGEHALIGDTAFERFADQFENKINNLEMKFSYRYGELVALSGDMFKSVEEIALHDPLIGEGFYGRNRESLKKCVAKEIHAIRHEPAYSGCDDTYFATKKIRYVTLAHDNYSHFAWHNIKEYLHWHEKALWFAKLAHLKCDEAEKKSDKKGCEARKKTLQEIVAKSDYKKKLSSKYRKFPKLFPRKKFSQRYFINIPKHKMIDLALFANAYADHFLSDAFAAGHMRVPRSQIDGFVNAGGKVKDKDKRAEGTAISGALTQFLHNNDGTLDGLKVSNSLKQTFVIRSDKQLFAKPGSAEMSNKVEDNSQLIHPVNAVEASIAEVLAVIKNGEAAMPKGVYEGLKHVPFVSEHDPALADVIRDNVEKRGSVKEAVKTMSAQMQLIFKAKMKVDDLDYKAYFASFVDAIPDMMAQLRGEIAEQSKDEKIRKRIPESLMTALLKLR